MVTETGGKKFVLQRLGKLQLPPSLYMKHHWANTWRKKDSAILPIWQLGTVAVTIKHSWNHSQRSPGYASRRRLLVWCWEGRRIAAMWRNVRVVRSFLTAFMPTHGLHWGCSLKVGATGILGSPAGASLKRGSAQAAWKFLADETCWFFNTKIKLCCCFEGFTSHGIF